MQCAGRTTRTRNPEGSKAPPLRLDSARASGQGTYDGRFTSDSERAAGSERQRAGATLDRGRRPGPKPAWVARGEPGRSGTRLVNHARFAVERALLRGIEEVRLQFHAARHALRRSARGS